MGKTATHCTAQEDPRPLVTKPKKISVQRSSDTPDFSLDFLHSSDRKRYKEYLNRSKLGADKHFIQQSHLKQFQLTAPRILLKKYFKDKVLV